jgi:SAM-dependent MidA family methyltransferase
MTATHAHSTLPALSADEERHSAALAAVIREHIAAAGGALSFERFMELALYAPGLGYYSAGSVKLGAQGDFYTAPEMSDLFSRCLARQCAQVLEVTGGQILELGAGSGRMAAVILTELARSGVVPERYAILEVSADLASRQRARLSTLPGGLREKVVWLETLPQQPIDGVILANEVADALPFRRFTMAGGAARELAVAADGEGFRDALRAPDAALAAAIAELGAELPAPLAEGYVSEACLTIEPWVAAFGEVLRRGLILLCDYGLPRRHYYHAQRTRGTLRCHFRQRAHEDPYRNVGLQDITAWVDFTRIAQGASAADLAVAGFATQAAALVSLGLEGLVAAVGTDLERARLAGEARRLILPGEMGEAFKMMALTRELDAPLEAFALQDLRHLL